MSELPCGTSEDALWELAEGTAADSPAGLLNHVESCAGCQERLSEMRQLCTGLESIATTDASGDSGRIGPYKTLLELGRGGQGVVYLAEDTRLGRKVALKVLANLGPGMKDSIKRLHREAEVASKLEHPGICAIHDAGVESAVPFIAMRYVEGETLAQRIQSARGANGDVPSSFMRLEGPEVARVEEPEEAGNEDRSTTTTMTRAELGAILDLIGKSARALHVAHEAGIIHRDVKPANIMIDREGEPVVLDFGLARLEDDGGPGASLTRTGDLFGTPAYMSPEQLTAQRIPLDRRTDIWSLGVTLYECLTLRRPFEAPTRHGVYQAILSREPPDPRRFSPAIPTDLKVILETALQKDRDRRYQTALALAEDLHHVQRHEPIQARPVGRMVRTWLWAQRNPAVASLLAVVFILLAGGLAWTLTKNRQLDRTNLRLDSLRTAAETNLAKVTRLADQRELEQLRERLAELGPSTPENADCLAAWVAAAHELLARLPQHREALEALRRTAHPYAENDRLRDDRADLEQIEHLRQRLEKIRRHHWGSRPRGRIELGETALQLQELEAKVSRRRVWTFDRREDAWRHQVLARLCDDLEHFARKDVPLVEKRLDFVRLAARRLNEDDVLDWLVDTDTVARKQVYGGLELTPQLGLFPVGPDPDSGLHEYLHLETHEGPIPARDLRGRLPIDESTGLILVLVPGGTFHLGAQQEDPAGPNYDPDARWRLQGPVREVTLKAFFISKFEMSIAQWSRATNEPPEAGYARRTHVRPLLDPRTYVSWHDCQEVLAHLDLVLPTEARWEYAARGGTSTPWWTGATKRTLLGAANLGDSQSGIAQTLTTLNPMTDFDDGYIIHAPVCSLRPNPFGLHHVCGNVHEWCRDEGRMWNSYARTDPRQADGSFSNPGPPVTKAMIRGGCYRNPVKSCRSAWRSEAMLTDRQSELGLRPAREIVHRPLPEGVVLPRAADRGGLIDWSELQALLAEEARLWPALPDTVPRPETWLARARHLADRVSSSYAIVLEPPVVGNEVGDSLDSPELRSLREQEAGLKQTLASLESSEPLPVRELGIRRDTPPQREVVRRRLERELEGISGQVRELSVRESLVAGQSFAHPGERRAFVRRLRVAQALPELRNAIESVERRLRAARPVHMKSLEDHAEAWAQATSAIAASPLYAGMRLEPLMGFVPLGKDPDSGLWELAHLVSGAAPERDPKSGKLQITEDTGLVFVLVPGGKFLMGAQKDDPEGPNYDPQAGQSEGPVHEVALDPFLLSKYEMSQAQWLRVAGDNPSSFAPGCPLAPVSGLHPVETIEADEAERMLARLGLQLPTEAQWECACRAGTSTPWWTGPDARSILGKGNLGGRATNEIGFRPPSNTGSQSPTADDGLAVHAPIASFDANPWGLHDLIGNVGEICRDWSSWARQHYSLPVDEGTGLRHYWGGWRVRRGSDSCQAASASRSAWRGDVERAAHSVGLRPSRDLTR